MSDTEAQARDAALDALAAARAELVAWGRTIAIALCVRNGHVTSTEVKAALTRLANFDPRLSELLDTCDPRWMGVVFRGKDWVQDGWDDSGSHKRRVPIWKRP
jgi:hypothetical protein